MNRPVPVVVTTAYVANHRYILLMEGQSQCSGTRYVQYYYEAGRSLTNAIYVLYSVENAHHYKMK